MKKSDGDRARLLHILEAIQYIHSFITGKVKSDIYNGPMLRFAIERQLEIIGEAANHLSDNIKSTHPELNGAKLLRSEISWPMNISASTSNSFGTLSFIKYRHWKTPFRKYFQNNSR